MFEPSNKEFVERDVAKLIANFLPSGQYVEGDFAEVRCDATAAFLFADIAGATYQDSGAMPFSPRGLTKVVHSAFRPDMVVGLFEEGVPYNTPLALASRRPYLFVGPKFIVPIAAMNWQDLQKRIRGTKIQSETGEYCILWIDLSKRGFGLEGLLEAACAFSFRQSGYCVESQVPLGHAVGSPDFLAVTLDDATAGHLLLEIALVRQAQNSSESYSLWARPEILSTSLQAPIFVGEAKTSTTAMAAQLAKYLASGIFTGGYEIHECLDAPKTESHGLLSIRDYHLVKIAEPGKTRAKDQTQRNYIRWLEGVRNLYALANFGRDELCLLGSNLLGASFRLSPLSLYTLASTTETRAAVWEFIQEVSDGAFK